MKDKPIKVIFILVLILLILISLVGGFALFNYFVAYKSATQNDWINFAGGIVGSFITGIVAFATLFVTIRSNNKNQEKANNLQASLKIEDNLNKKMEMERSLLSVTYNQLENFLFTVANMSNGKDDYIAMRNDFFRMYKEISSSLNNITFNSDAFDDKSFLKKRERSEIKSYIPIVSTSTDIRKEIFVIVGECKIILNYLESALNKADQITQCSEEMSVLKQMNMNNAQILSLQNLQTINKIDYIAPNLADLEHEKKEILQQIENNRNRISEIEELIKNNMEIIKEQMYLAKNKAIQIDTNNKPKLYNLIRKYFDNYNSYIEEIVIDVQMNGKKPDNSCAKLDCEKNHKTED